MATEEKQEKASTAVARSVAAEVIPQEVAIVEMQKSVASIFAQSGLFAEKDVTDSKQQVARAFVKIQMGASMNFTPAESMLGINIVSGQLSIGSALRAARMQRAGYSWPEMVLTDKGCWMPLRYQGKPMMQAKVDPETGEIERSEDGTVKTTQVVVSFTEADARRSKTTIWKSGQKTVGCLLDKDNWQNNPKNMYYARCVSNAQRFYAPGVLGASGDRVMSTEEVLDADFADMSFDVPASDIQMPKRVSQSAEPVQDATMAAALFELGKGPDPNESKQQ